VILVSSSGRNEKKNYQKTGLTNGLTLGNPGARPLRSDDTCAKSSTSRSCKSKVDRANVQIVKAS
jgi:hypothetical protein